MRWSPIETDLLGALETLARRGAAAAGAGPLYLVLPEGVNGDEAAARLLLEEGRAFHETERDVARRHARALEKRAAALAGGVEHDRAGTASARSLPGHGEALDRLAAAEERARAHDAALGGLSRPDAGARARAALAGFERRPRGDLAGLKDALGPGEVAEVFADGWSLRRTPLERLAARREHLGLPAGADWG